MKKLEINSLSEVSGGNPCFYLGVAAVVSVLGGPVCFFVANGIIAGVASYLKC